MKYLLMSLLIMATWVPVSHAADAPPWGKAQMAKIEYTPSKVVYDVASSDVKSFAGVLDRASFLNNIYNADPFNASIVLVLHGKEIDFFAIKHYATHKDLMRRAQSLTLGGPIKFRVCAAAARMRGYQPGDLHGFVEFVPMADAEIIRLQTEEGYAYMQ